MTILRLVLFLGLVVRRVHIEVLRHKHGVGLVRRPGAGLLRLSKWLVQIFLAVQALFLDVFPISSQPGTLRVPGVALFCAGLAMTLAGRQGLGRNWVDLEDYRIVPGQSVVTRGPYRYLRHPVYTGDLLLFIGLELALNSWLVVAAIPLAVIMIKQASAEEVLLSETFPQYKAYCERTKRFIPFVV